jgi:DNA-binding SARP family transcriptional activator
LFWPELDQEHARTALRQALRVLRNALGPELVVTRGDEEIGLDFEELWSDVAAFDHAMDAGQALEALDLYRGPLLPGFFIPDAPDFERWLETERARLQQRASTAAGNLVLERETQGDLTTAVHWARRAAQLAPDDETLTRRLIALLDRQGDRAGALRAYEEFAQRLAAEYEATPAAETRTLIAAVRARETVSPSVDRVVAKGSQPEPGTRVSVPDWPRTTLTLGASLAAVAALALLIVSNSGSWREQRRPDVARTRNAEAYDLYVRGKVLLQQGNRHNDSVAITLAARAVTLDPNFAGAWAELSRAEALRVFQFVREDSAAYERAQVAAERALRLDPNLAEAHHAQAVLLWWSPDPDWSGPGHFAHERAIAEDRRALALDSTFDRARHHLGNIYLHIGLLDEAIAQLRQVLASSPRDDNAVRRIAEAIAYQGRHEEALRILSQVRPEAGSPFWHYQMVMALLHLGRTDSAFTVIRDYLRTHPEDRGGVVTSARAVWYALGGDAQRAQQDIRTAIEKGQGYIHFHHAAYHIALAYALLHQPDSAIHWLRAAADGGLPCYSLFLSDSFLDNVRSDPGFIAFMREQKTQWERFRATL